MSYYGLKIHGSLSCLIVSLLDSEQHHGTNLNTRIWRQGGWSIKRECWCLVLWATPQ